MKIAYFDCFSGVSGDMILGALIDAGLDLEELESELAKLKISGYSLRAEKTDRNEISGTKFSVDVTDRDTGRSLPDIVGIIDRSLLDDEVKSGARKIFRRLAEVEAKIHHKDVEEIHFHEVGGLDSIVDVVGSLIGLKKYGVDVVCSSKIHVGTGFLECRHGVLPVPAPATIELLKDVPIYSQGLEAELTTPTGAAILTALAKNFGNMPEMKVERIGYGVGNRRLGIPNLLRICIGEAPRDGYERDNVVLVQTNIDDMNPEFFDYVLEALIKQGALDVYAAPVLMKKNRPATMLNILVSPDKLEEILSTVFTETTTFGVRISHLERKILSREIVSAETGFGEVKVKIGRIGEAIKSIAPEYESCKEIAVRAGVPLKDVYDAAKEAVRRELSSA